MIGIIHNINIPEIFAPMWQDYESIILEDDRKYRCERGWDYGAIVHHGEFAETDVVIDIGGSISYLFIYLTKFVKESWCIDPIFEYGTELTVPWLKTLCHYDEYLNGKARLHMQNARKLPFPDNSVDKVITCSAMEHFKHDDDILCAKEVGRILKPDGIFLGTVDYNYYKELMPEKYGEARFYTHDSFKSRILYPSGLQLFGEDYLDNEDVPEYTDETKYTIQAMFFKLRKP